MTLPAPSSATSRTTRPLVLAVPWQGTTPSEDLLGAAERAFADRLPPWRRRTWTAGRCTAHAALHLLLSSPTQDVQILPGPEGAPRLVADTAQHCTLSLAHCDTWIACACGPSAQALGIDVEEDGACDARLLARVSAPGQPATPSANATLEWARKEAAYKACCGIPPTLKAYHLVSPDLVAVTSAAGDTQRFLATWTTQLPGSVLALATEGPLPPQLHVLDAPSAHDLLHKGVLPQ